MREKDAILFRQVLAERPYQYKKYSSNLTDTWQLIVDAMSVVDGFENITVKGMREHFTQLMDGRRKQVNAEKKLSGVAIEEKEWTQVAVKVRNRT